jgi:hypothetical protein
VLLSVPPSGGLFSGHAEKVVLLQSCSTCVKWANFKLTNTQRRLSNREQRPWTAMGESQFASDARAALAFEDKELCVAAQQLAIAANRDIGI